MQAWVQRQKRCLPITRLSPHLQSLCTRSSCRPPFPKFPLPFLFLLHQSCKDAPLLPLPTVSLDKEQLLTAAKSALGARQFKARCPFLEAETDVLDPEEEPFEVGWDGLVDFEVEGVR